MRAVVQRVKQASVTINNSVVADIGIGLMVLIGIAAEDAAKDRAYLINKLINLRVFDDDEGKMNRSIQDINGQLLLVSQFTLYGDCRKGNRPSFIAAMPPAEAQSFYEQFVAECQVGYPKTYSGVFQAEMDVSLINHGPITILIDTAKQF